MTTAGFLTEEAKLNPGVPGFDDELYYPRYNYWINELLLAKRARNIPNNQFFKGIHNRSSKVSLEDPEIGQFDKKLYDQAAEVISICFLSYIGHPPQVLSMIEEKDLLRMRPNLNDPDIYTFLLQAFVAEKEGKTKDEICVHLDAPTPNIVYRYLAKFYV